MAWTPVAVAVALSLAITALADPGGRPNERSKKQRPEKEGRITNKGQILFIGGHRVSDQYEAGEAWRREKDRAYRDEKARRDQEAQARLAREQERRDGERARREREKDVAARRRDTEKARQDDRRDKATKKKAEVARR